MRFKDIIQKIEKNKIVKESNGLTSILPPFERLSKVYGGFTKGSITCITSNQGTGKTKFTKFLTIHNVYKKLFNSNLKVKIFYFALEESENDFWLSFISYYLYEKYSITISISELKSVGNYTITDDLLKKIVESENYIKRLQNMVEIIDYIRSPTQICKYIEKYFNNPEIGEHIYDSEGNIKGYKHKDENLWQIFVLDHISLISNDYAPGTKNRFNSYQSFDFIIKDIVLERFSKRYDMVNVIVHQQTPSSEKKQYTSKGGLVETKLEPSLEELHINKGVNQDYEIVLGLFNPYRYNMEEHGGYDIKILKQYYRSLMFLKDRDYGLESSQIGLFFNGANGDFIELPHYTQMGISRGYENAQDMMNKIKN